MKEYATISADALGNREAMLDLWRRGLTHAEKPERKFDWYYGGNPSGVPLVEFLVHAGTGQRVGVASAGLRRMRLGDRELRGGSMVDFVVDPAHRTFFPAITLQKGICRQALATFDLLFGLPNAKSEAAVKRVGYRQVGLLQRSVRILRAEHYLSRHLPASLSKTVSPIIDAARLASLRVQSLAASGYRTEWLDRPDDRFDELWMRTAGAERIIGVRDRTFLDWRFARCPVGTHRFFTVQSRKARRLVAYAACERVGDVVHIRDFLVAPGRPDALTRLLSELAREAHGEGAASLSIEFLGPRHLQHHLAANGFVERESHPFYAVLPGDLARLADTEHWYITGADDDI